MRSRRFPMNYESRGARYPQKSTLTDLSHMGLALFGLGTDNETTLDSVYAKERSGE